MRTAEEQHQNLIDEEPGLGSIPVAKILATLWCRRRWLATVTGIGMLLSVVVAFVIPKHYESTAELLPPDQKSITSLSVMDPLSSVSAVTGGSFLTTRTPGQTIIGILSSETVQNAIVDRLNLMKVYRSKLHMNARTGLSKRTTLDEDKKSGIITITVDDTDPKRACDIAAAYIEELDNLLIAENSSSAHLERVFLENRLKSLKDDLDATTLRLSKFSSANATLNPQTQGTALMDAATKLQGELITAESELDGLKAQYSDDNVRVKVVRARISELQSQLTKMDGMTGAGIVQATTSSDPFPSLRQLPLLGATYSDLYRQMMMQENIYETLTKQYELAKVQEAKEIPTIRVLDQPQIPEKKYFPRRSLIMAGGTLLAAFLATIWIVIGTLLGSLGNPLTNLVTSVQELVRTEKPV